MKSTPLLLRLLLLGTVTAAELLAQSSRREAALPLSSSIRTSWTIENGLPQNTVYRIVQSRDGYVWLATQDGVARFDGLRFTPYNRQTVPGFPSNFVTAMTEDRAGRLWLGTNAGVVVVADGRATPLPGALNGRVIRTLVEDRDSSLLVGTTTGLYRVRGGSVEPLPLPRMADEWDVRAIVRHSDGGLWIGTEQQGLFRWDGRSLEHFGPTVGLRGQSINVLLEGTAGDLWVGLSGGMQLLRRGRFQTVTLDARAPGLPVHAIIPTPSGGFWVGTGAGVYLLKDVGNRPEATPLSGDDISQRWTVFSLLSDREGSLWIGTFARGLHQYAASHFATSTPLSFLNEDFIFCVFRDSRDRIWVGTDGQGAFVMSPGGAVRQISTRNGLPNDGVFTIAEDSRGTIWLGTTGGGLVEYRGRVERVFTTDNGMPNNFIRALVEDREGYLWIGTRSGLCRMADGLIENFTRAQGLTSLFIHTLATDRMRRIWVGTLGGGALRFDGDRFTPITSADGLSSNDVRAIVQDADGSMWFGTEGGGLARYDGTSVRTVSTAQGLVDESIFSISDDGLGHVWLSSNHGLMRLDRSELRLFLQDSIESVRPLLFDRRDGMRSEECNAGQPSVARDREGRFWYPTIGGVAILHPGELRRTSRPPQVVIEAVVGDGAMLLSDEAATVPPGTRDVEIQYTGLSFLSSDKLVFRYRLEGLQDDWVEAGLRRSAFFTTLEPGSYVFHVTARSADGQWNETDASLPIVVEARFYQTRWFRIAGVIVTLAFVAGLSNVRVRQVERRRALLEQQVRERTAELERQMAVAHEASEFKTRLLDLAAHDLKSPLISIRGFAQLARHEPPTSPAGLEAADAIQRLSQTMLALINELLDASMIEQGRLQLVRRSVDLSSLALSVAGVHRVAAERKRQWIDVLIAPPGTCQVEVDVGRIQACIENLVTNALKFSPPGTTITIRVEPRDDWARVSVLDQGPGLTDEDRQKIFGRFQKLSARPTAGEPSTGLGLSIVKQIVELHGGRVSAESPAAGGSHFSIDLPRVSRGT